MTAATAPTFIPLKPMRSRVGMPAKMPPAKDSRPTRMLFVVMFAWNEAAASEL